MKKIIFGIIGAAILVTGSIFVIAQRSSIKGGHEFGRGFRGHRGGIEMALRGLDLTAEQKSAINEITGAGETAIQPLLEQTRANREKTRSLGTDGKFDQAQVEALAAEQGDLTTKIIIEKERAKAQIFALLTDEQKAKAETLRSRFEEKRRSHRGEFKKNADSDL